MPTKLRPNRPMLYNLDQDPREEHNVIKEQAGIARELIALLSAHIQRAGRVAWQ